MVHGLVALDRIESHRIACLDCELRLPERFR
ncbi:MAG: hypothetical protein ACJAYX_003905 [Planctomycetota bacterium]